MIIISSCQDVEKVLGADVADAVRASQPDPHYRTRSDASPDKLVVAKKYKVDYRFHIAYILTLGVADNFRRVGIGVTVTVLDCEDCCVLHNYKHSPDCRHLTKGVDSIEPFVVNRQTNTHISLGVINECTIFVDAPLKILRSWRAS